MTMMHDLRLLWTALRESMADIRDAAKEYPLVFGAAAAFLILEIGLTILSAFVGNPL